MGSHQTLSNPGKENDKQKDGRCANGKTDQMRGRNEIGPPGEQNLAFFWMKKKSN